MNSVNFIGRLTDKPTIRRIKNGKAVANFSIAVNSYGDKTYFFNCSAWEQKAEFLEKYAEKGKQISFTGAAMSESYITNNGENRTVVRFLAREISFLEKIEKQKKTFKIKPEEATQVVEEEETPW